MRRSSVYDLTSLRLHPDGLRVRQSERNLDFNHDRPIIQDSRRQWIADDAGGVKQVPLYVHTKRSSSSPASGEHLAKEEVDADDDEYEYEEDDSESNELDEEDGLEREGKRDVSGGKRRKKRRKNIRVIRKKKFMEDYSYLSSPRHSRECSSSELPEMPSQDLLKNIHQFGARYYDRQGLLLDASRQYRRDKRERDLRRHDPLHAGTPENSRSSPDLPEDEGASVSENEAERQRRVTRDMYRVLDGSVLLAIGVLTQELVKKLLRQKRRGRAMKVVPSDGEAGELEEDPIEDYEDEDGAKLSSPRHARVEGKGIEKGDDYAQAGEELWESEGDGRDESEASQLSGQA